MRTLACTYRRSIGVILAIAAAAIVWAATSSSTTSPDTQTWTSPVVIDGDTLEATNPDGQRERIRILGINAPEWDACGGAEATAYLEQLLDGAEHIQLVRDPSQPERDKYDRVLAYIELENGTDLGLTMIKAGHAQELSIGPPHERAIEYRESEQPDART